MFGFGPNSESPRQISGKQKPRAWIVSLTAQGKRAAALMKALKASNPTLNLWRRAILSRVECEDMAKTAFASWLNVVERFCREITMQRIRHSVFQSVTDFEASWKSHYTLRALAYRYASL